MGEWRAHCHQKNIGRGAATRKTAHFGKGINMSAKCVEKLVQRGVQVPSGDLSFINPSKLMGAQNKPPE